MNQQGTLRVQSFAQRLTSAVPEVLSTVTGPGFSRTFLTDAEDILEKLDSSVGNLQLAGKGEGRIDIAFLRTLGSDFVPRILRRFLDENQGKQIDFTLHCDKVITH